MGCDIHVMLERKRNINSKEKWVNIDYWKMNSYYGEDEYERKMNLVDFYDGRNYNLFALLADVRNRAGVKPISEPKGIPEDCSKIVKEEYEYWEGDAHSASYLTLKELMYFYRNNPNQLHKGMISREQQIALDERDEKPDSWCGGTNQEGFEMREWYDESDLKYFLEELIKRAKEELYIWSDKLNEEIYKQSDNIRVVFWFDN